MSFPIDEEPVSFWREDEISRRHFTTSFCDTGLVANTSPRNAGNFVFLESWKSLAIIIQNNFFQFVAHKE